VAQLQKIAKTINLTDDNIIRYADLKGLRPEIRSYVLQNNAKNIADVKSFERIAEQVRPETTTPSGRPRGRSAPAVGHCPANVSGKRSAERTRS